MSNHNLCLLNELEGLPFVSTHFSQSTLLKRLASHRYARFGKKYQLEDYLNPDVIFMNYRKVLVKPHLACPQYCYLNYEEFTRVQRAIASILALIPQWHPYFQLGVNIHKIEAEIQLTWQTQHVIPQIIFLGDNAFKSQKDLEEIIIGEMAHIWLALISELEHFQHNALNNKHLHPADKVKAEKENIIFSAHSSATVLYYLRKKRLTSLINSDDYSREAYVSDYLQDCLNRMNNMNGLTLIGTSIMQQLEETFQHA